jgi:hypothetical protein
MLKYKTMDRTKMKKYDMYLCNSFLYHLFKRSCDFLGDYRGRSYIVLKIKVHFQGAVFGLLEAVTYK